MKILKSIFTLILAIIVVVILTLGIYLLIVGAQQLIFVPEDYLLWIFKYPYSRLVIIYEIYLIILVFYLANRGFKKDKETRKGFFMKHKKVTLPAFVLVNIVLLYAILFNVTVMQKDRITDYSFFAPQGMEYSYDDVKKVSAGVHDKKFPFKHSKGDFYYIIELSDGKKIDLTEVGGVKNSEHEYFVLVEIDQQLVERGIPKNSSMENFEFTTDHLAKTYTDKIKEILENTN